MLKIYNSFTQKKDVFTPIEPDTVRLYVCGMTVYDYCHIGHARTWIVFDVIVKYLRKLGYRVIYVQNITDIDDKIIHRARENQEDWKQLTQRFIEAFHEDSAALNVVPPDIEPRATDFIPQIVTLIERLIAKNYAYVADNGDVCFNVREFKNYGQLSHRNLDQLRAGVRIGINENKRDPLDFVLWKSAKPGEPHWSSPWGEGRPGWHIECSAMASDLLGQPFDIHGGGLDLKFPHHENERAQSEAASGCTFVNVWVHSGLLEIDREKMSKSLGNIVLIRDALSRYDPEILRYFYLSAHYRSPLSFSEENLATSQTSLERLYVTLRGLSLSQKWVPTKFSERFCEAMEDDFNTPEALAVLFDLSHHINRLRDQNRIQEAEEYGQELKELASLLGILQKDPERFLKGPHAEAQKIEALIEERTRARNEKNWQKADRIRDELQSMGIAIEDTSKGTLWKRE